MVYGDNHTRKVFRAEQGYIACYSGSGRKAVLAGDNLKSLFNWLKTDHKDKTIRQYMASGFFSDSDRDALHRVLRECVVQESPPFSLSLPEQLQVELTTKCPLNCNQCYCNLEGREINKEQLFSYLYQAAWLGIPTITLSGGEPLLYPSLIETVELISRLGLYSALATSGAGLTSETLRELKDAGLNDLFFSLNGSTKEIHSISRDGFEETISAMTVAKNENIPFNINWVAREDNVLDFNEVLKTAEKLGAQKLVILSLKPDCADQLQAPLSTSSLQYLAGIFKNHDQEQLALAIEGCFPSLLMAVLDTAIPGKIGCEVGRTVLSVNVDGSLSPCRHIPLHEEAQPLKTYWYESKNLAMLRDSYNGLSGTCTDCRWHDQCHPCRANAMKLHDDVYAGENECGGFSAQPARI